jgi:hypothetical protein
MDLHEWLDSETGRATALADELGVTKGAVSLWRDNGVPMDQMRRIAEFAGGSVTVDEMLRHAFRCREERKRAAKVA